MWLLYLRGEVTTFFMQTINITVPQGWHELTQKQLRYLFFPCCPCMHIKNLDKRNCSCNYSTMPRLSERDTSLTCNLTASDSWFNEINASSERSHAARCSRAVRVTVSEHCQSKVLLRLTSYCLRRKQAAFVTST